MKKGNFDISSEPLLRDRHFAIPPKVISDDEQSHLFQIKVIHLFGLCLILTFCLWSKFIVVVPIIILHSVQLFCP